MVRANPDVIDFMTTLFRNSPKATIGLFAALLAVPAIQAATTNYGTFVGTSVTYDVSEFAITDPLPLFGAPTLIGNTLDFNPTFSSFAAGGASDQTDGQLNLLIKANAGNAIPSVLFSEQGDFTFTGLGGTANTYASVSALFNIDVYKVDGIALVTPLNLVAQMTFAPSASGFFDKVTFPNPPGTHFWSGSFNFDVNAALTTAGIVYTSGATEISVSLDNILETQSELGTSARISKKDFKGLGITVPSVPEPSIFALTLCGAGWLLARRRAGR